MKNIKEILNKIKNKNTITSVGASIARPSSKARPHTKTILIMLLILILLIATLIAIGITNAANSTTEPQTNQTFTEEGDGYYIWVRAVDHAGNKGPWSEAQRVWIDATGPSAPTITGGSSEYALSRTISVSTASDDNGASGVAYYEYYKKSGADKPADSVTGTQVTTSATSQKFDTNTAGEYVFFRAVDVVGNKGAWSEGQQVFIDVNAPKVTAKNSSVTITEGDSVEMSTYFTVAANGTNTNITTTYKIGSTSYTNTSSLAVGTYTVTCTATKIGGNSSNAIITLKVEAAGITALQVAVAPETYYGKEIKGYTCTNSAGVNKWLIFHSDGENIYMISDDYIHYNYAPASANYSLIKNTNYKLSFYSVYNDYKGSASITDSRIKKWISYVSTFTSVENINIRAVVFMLDYNIWSAKFGNSTYADYAIGGPTLDMFVESYNNRYPTLNIKYSIEFYGYTVGTGGASSSYSISGLGTSDSLYIIKSTSKAYGCWLAAPSAGRDTYIYSTTYSGGIGQNAYNGNYAGFRPVVCLSSNVKLIDNGDGTYGLTL